MLNTTTSITSVNNTIINTSTPAQLYRLSRSSTSAICALLTCDPIELQAK
jgi:hypothetical protein